ncbi:ABC transporter permease [Anaerobacillus sp. HL2]|nr:ABC transporter permease [Anaerobacillus sp. HL2]
MLLWRSVLSLFRFTLYDSRHYYGTNTRSYRLLLVSLLQPFNKLIVKCSIPKIKALGATNFQRLSLLLRETKLAIMAAIMAGLGRVLAEVGATMMVGGNIKGDTRILTTSMVMEVSKGNFDVAIALSFILINFSIYRTFLLTSLQQRKQSV